MDQKRVGVLARPRPGEVYFWQGDGFYRLRPGEGWYGLVEGCYKPGEGWYRSGDLEDCYFPGEGCAGIGQERVGVLAKP